MSAVHLLPENERKLFFDTAATETGISHPIVEKDFWVVWILEQLFSLEELKSHLIFKGGTSLSKVYGIIQRFSEDIDLSIDKNFLGFNKDKDPEKAESKKKQRAFVDAIANTCSKYVQNKMLDDLHKNIAAKLGSTEGWELTIDAKDPDGQTILFHYPRTISKGGYIQQSIKIEMGARSDHWPISEHKIQSYLKTVLKGKVTEPDVLVKVLNAERTFWEKATILHQYAHLPDDKKLPPRVSRHYYDFFCLLNSSIKAKAISDQGLLERVAVHKSIYFASSWANYIAARKGSLRLSPLEGIRAALEEDYELMKQMFFGNIPEWELILETIQAFEIEFNTQKQTKVAISV